MSPLPNRPLQPPKSYAAETAAEGSDMPQSPDASDPKPPTAQRPLVRPVARPQPAPAAPTSPPPAVEKPPEPEIELFDPASLRQQPIPAPSEPMQYRAIGLLRGRYTPSEEQFTRGEMKTADGTTIEAVLLGRVMSLVKNHLDLEQEHLWVVYPRTREKHEDLHVQIVGVWEPENLSKSEEESEAEETPNYLPSSEVEDNYFSIRGEVIFHTPEEKSMVIKIQQAPRKKDDRAKAFKLKLRGELTGKSVGYFWEINAKREGADLVVMTAKSIGMIPPRKKSKEEIERGRFSRPGGRFGGGGGGGRRPFGDRRPSGGDRRPSGAAPQPQAAPRRTEPLPKPVKRRTDEGTDNVTSEA
ncbi:MULTISPECIES: hypothetical protein [Leptolyngbya]|jgi:hypothetical protein|uniref:Uncharacterized protein n=1 Tax=Leptolyngbya boryana NIES-2135 TaxID=1973484 RepID=A0A1Z4JJC6_LEPBY|nr:MULTISPECIES: hypothetical protein [Leptolyngbya]BAY56831.1 hypothetical protein NIES2135_36710 [Leptolyngbya boryana NIES-2135]MBD2368909.1 hypothetical protein [Leptolyngbya sp. FACHB-161]MBD2375884.1 hypothetical protein [Leptolyngbya sp. FACHB-238]MBD2399998.1 hypothetical protein [Leptolyngbya sp. FACHB-239]MBD2406204.1 hypothetical protein [Leptolyngbya sp. FACHB-402]